MERWHEIVPPTIEGIRGYLSSGLLKGIGPKTADAIVQRFGIQSGTVTVNFDGRFADYPLESLGDLDLSYATTIHKRILQ